MPLVPLDKVQFLSLREIAQMWSPEAQIPESVMLRELQTAVINIPRLDKGKPLLDRPLSDDELPDPNQRVDREWLMKFCEKQGWNDPVFWKGELRHQEPSFVGRPSKRAAIVQELKRRSEAGEMKDTLAAEARTLSAWAQEKFPSEQTPKPKSTENGIRDEYNQLKRQRR